MQRLFRPVLLCALILAAGAARLPATPTPVPATPTEAPVPLEEVALRAQEVTELLEDVDEALQINPEVEKILQEMPAWTSRVDQLQDDAVHVFSRSPSRSSLDLLAGPWQAAANQLNRWKDVLAARGHELQAFVERLDEVQRTWLVTRDVARRADAPASIRQRISETIAAVSESSKRLEDRRDQLLLLQDQNAKLLARTNEVRRDIDRLREDLVSQLGERNGKRIWEIRWTDLTATAVEADGPSSPWRQLGVLRDYVTANLGYIVLHLSIFVGLIPLLMRIRKRIPTWVERNPLVARAMPVIALPVSSALIASILISFWIYPPAPRIFSVLVGLISVVPTLRIVRRLVDHSLLPVVHTFAAFFVFDRLRRLFDLPLETVQVLFLLQMAVSIGAIFWLVSTGRLSLTVHAGESIVSRAIEYMARALMVVFALSLTAVSLGYLWLADWLASGFLSAGYLAIGLYATYRVAQGVVAYVLRSEVVRQVKLTQDPVVERRLNLGLRWLAAAIWLSGTLLISDLLDSFLNALSAIFTARFTIGELSLSLGSIVAFALTVWLAFLLSRFTRYVLAEDVFPRLSLARGVPYAVSALVHYLILLIGFFLAFAAMGLDLNRFTILAGAFGVGIGFGMQNIVNNFVSGLILLFERPVQVGDTVQLGQFTGEVVRIGIRSSAIRTAQGAEVIVPNALFISETVTNWTLSDRMRRIDVAVGVAYGSDPERVLALLKEVATNHPLVLTEPPPITLFVGFGDSALNFELRVWTNRFEEWFRISSELNIGVNAALKEAGIGIPFPQRDLHLDSLKAVDVRIVDSKE
jgi:small-conductance mechanosensitive channel